MLAADKAVSPAPLLMRAKLDRPWRARPPHFPALAIPCERAARASQREGDGVIPKALPVFRSGKCSGGSREVLGTGGRKVLSTGGEGPSGSRDSRGLQGEATLLETLPSCHGPPTRHPPTQEWSIGHCLSRACDSCSVGGQKGLSRSPPQAPVERIQLLDLPCLGAKAKKSDGTF